MDKIHLLILSLLLLFLSSCYEQQKYPPEPKIDFRQIVVKDTVDPLGNKYHKPTIYFKILDGDNDFGIDTTKDYAKDSVFLKNIFVKVYYQVNGNVFEYDADLDGLIPEIPPVGLNNYFKALIIYDIEILLPSMYPIRFEFYVIDRALNKSNVQITPWIDPEFTGVLVDTNNLIID